MTMNSFNKTTGIVCTVFTLLISISAAAQNLQANISDNIRLNQLGFYPNAPKIAVITSGRGKFIIQTEKNELVYSGELKESITPGLNNKRTFIADFTSLNKSGNYTLTVEGLGRSVPFEIAPSVHRNLAAASVKAFYYQRASIALTEQYAGKWHRAMGHPDDKIMIHPSGATQKRAVGSMISASKGWYDAGDYNKYIVNSGVTMGTMLSLCEDFPDYVKKLNTNIPESKNAVPDVLDELVWNLRWMLAMQDPDDGGVYNKLTNANFDGMVMPDVPRTPRYVVQKGTAATLDFAAVTAQASRLLKAYKKDLPGLSDSCIIASKKAWDWARKNPNMAYVQNSMNAKFEPKIVTGGYGDSNFADEFFWAGSELYITTGDISYYNAVLAHPDERMSLPSWNNVKLLGYYSLLRNEKRFKTSIPEDIALIREQLMTMTDEMIAGVDDRAYRTVMGKTPRDFVWGSNSVAGNQGVALIQTYLINADRKYLDYALANLDYLLGRNATGYSYVTGFGYKTPMNPHHRPSAADGIAEPIPGLLAGGPNPGMQDGVALPSSVPDEAYIDDVESYAANEIAINWNAPLVYLSNALEALQVKAGYSKTAK